MNVVIAQLNYTVGDFESNYKKIKSEMWKYKSKADLIVFSELCISGYYPFDLLLREDFQLAQEQIIERLKSDTLEFNISILIGASVRNLGAGKKLYNSALLISEGKIIFTYHKHLLPVYNIYDEARHFERGQKSPIFQFKGKKYAVLICEDIWATYQRLYHDSPEEFILGSKVEAVFILNGSPSNIGKMKDRFQIVCDLSVNLEVPCIYSNQVGGNDEIVYDGSSFITDNKGAVKKLLPKFKECSELVNLKKLNYLENYRHLNQEDHYTIIYNQLILGLKDYVVKSGFKGVVVGSSGGIDSALTLAIAVHALGADNVNAITMPSIYSSVGSINDSIELCRNLGIKLFERGIGEEYVRSCKDFLNVFGKESSKITQENMQARIRGRIIMEYSNHYGVLALSTGNKSEMSVGYATLYGDMNGALNILGDLYKEDVYGLSNYINKVYGKVIPQSILLKEPSAELSEDQKDSDSLPPYDLLDPILKIYIEGDTLSKEELALLSYKIKDIPKQEINRIHTLVNRSEFKRKQACPIIRIQNRSFGLGRQIPVVNRFI